MYRRRDYRQKICPCLGCGLTFRTGELEDHLKSHSGATSYLCRQCFLVLDSEAAYLHHVSGGQCSDTKMETASREHDYATAAQSVTCAASIGAMDDPAGAIPPKLPDSQPTLPDKCKTPNRVKKFYGFNVLYRCAYCKNRFENASQLSFHIEGRHAKNLRDKAFQMWDASAKQYRLLRSSADKPNVHTYSCLLCGTFSTTDLKDFTPHMRNVHGQYCCIECGRIFGSKGGLHTHSGSSHRKHIRDVPSSAAAGKCAADSNPTTLKTTGGTKTCQKPPANDTIRYRCRTCKQFITGSIAMQQHAYRDHGIYGCSYCSWTTTVTADSLWLHHCEKHKDQLFVNPVNRRFHPERIPVSSVMDTGNSLVKAASGGLVTFRSSDEVDEFTAQSKIKEEVPVTTKTYSGYRVPKSASAFARQLQNIGQRFHCCMFSCSFSTDSQLEFVEHLDGHSELGNQLSCIYCGDTVSSSKELLSHLNHRHWTLVHQCTLCFYRGSCKHYVKCHFQHAHQHLIFASLDVLPEENCSPRSPLSPAKVTTRPYQCGFQDCHFSVADLAAFTEHLAESHREATAFACSECCQSQSSIALLVEHLMEHGLAAVQCGYCLASADTLGGILLHLCYCHAEASPKLHVRDKNLEKAATEKRNVLTVTRYGVAGNPRGVEFQQRCYCCSHMLTGFKELKAHLAERHRLSPEPKELADHLFASYDYTKAVQKKRCPFCSFIAADLVTLQEHVLYQELQCADPRRQSESSTCGDEDDRQLQAWAEANLCFRPRDYACPYCSQTFSTTLSLGDHVSSHNARHPVVCKLCGMRLQGLVARDRHVLMEHGQEPDGNIGHHGCTVEDVSAKVQDVSSPLEEHSCPQCVFKSMSSRSLEEHRLRCDGPIESEQEVLQPFECTVCKAAFGLLSPLLEHGFRQHGLSYFCSDCYFGADDKVALQQSGHPCRGRNAFVVEHWRRSAEESTRCPSVYVREVTVVNDWDVYYKSRNLEYQDLDQLFVQMFQEKVMVVDLLAQENFEGFVKLCDIEAGTVCQHA